MKEELVENLKRRILEEIAKKANGAEQLHIETENDKEIEDMEGAIAKLEQDKASLEEEIRLLEGKTEFRDGILQKTTLQEKYEKELQRVMGEIQSKSDKLSEAKSFRQMKEEEIRKKAEQEIHQLNDERNQLETNLADIENLNTETKTLENALKGLEQDKASLEEEIRLLEGKTEFRDGILQKTTLQEKYEKELQSVMGEIQSKSDKLSKTKSFMQMKEEEIDKLLEKYHIEPIQNQQQETPIEEQKEESQQETPVQEHEEEPQQETPAQEHKEEPQPKASTQPQAPTKKEEKGSIPIRKNNDSIGRQPTVQIQNIACKVLDGGVPVYTVYMKMPDNSVVPYETSVNVGKDGSFKQLSKDEARRIEYKYNIIDASRYYDINLENVLAEVDRTYGTEGVKQYQTLMKTREGASVLDIDYNFSELYQTPTDPEAKMQLKSLRKLAKANYNLGLASYEKAPNLFKRLWKKITQKKLISREQERPNQTPQEIDNKDDQIQMQGKQLDPLEKKEQVLKAFQDLHDEPGFNVRRFAKAYNLSPEETREYINLQHKSGSTNREKFIKSIEVKKDELDTQKSIGKSVDEILKENQTDDNKKEKLQEEEQK